METKIEIRKRVLAVRDALSPEQRTRSELLLTERILGHQWYQGSESVLIYIKHGSELNTTMIIEDCFHHNKRVYIPKVDNDNMEFIRIYPGEALTVGYKGILEPQIKGAEDIFDYYSAETRKVLMLMPGVAFDPYRNRIGYGKGFYDRYLYEKENLHTIAIGFDCQMVPMIESEHNDIKPNQVICL